MKEWVELTPQNIIDDIMWLGDKMKYESDTKVTWGKYTVRFNSIFNTTGRIWNMDYWKHPENYIGTKQQLDARVPNGFYV